MKPETAQPPFWSVTAKQMASRHNQMAKALRKLVVGVLHGGWSEEREVSNNAARRLSEAFASLKIPFISISPQELPAVLSSGGVNVVYNVLYGELGEGGAVRSLIDLFGIPCTYSRSDSSAIALDKWRTKLLAEAAGIPTTWSVLVSKHNLDAAILEIEQHRDKVLICKPNTQGSSVGVDILKKGSDLHVQLTRAIVTFGPCLVEPFLTGREFSVGLIETENEGLQVLPILELRCGESSYMDINAKYQPAPTSKECPANVDIDKSASLAQYARDLHRLLGCYPVSRVDFREDERGNLKLLEINHYPGMTQNSWLPVMAAQAGLSYEDLAMEILMAALRDKKPPRVKTGDFRYDKLSELERCDTIIMVPAKKGPYKVSVEAAHYIQSVLGDSSKVVSYKALLTYALSGSVNKLVIDCLYGSEEIQWDESIWRGALDGLGWERIGPSVLTCALAIDKKTQKLLFKSIGAPSAPWTHLMVESMPADIGFPCVAKPYKASQSRGITILRDEDELSDFRSSISAEQGFQWFVESFLPGREFCVGVLERSNLVSECLPILEITYEDGSLFNDSQRKNLRRSQCSFPKDLSPKLRELMENYSLEIHRAFGSASLARIDWRLDQSGLPNVLEYDCTPGLTSSSYLTQMFDQAKTGFSGIVGELARVPGLRSCLFSDSQNAEP